MKSLLHKARYILDAETGIWSRPQYGGIAYTDGDEIEQRLAHIVKTAKDLSVLSGELRGYCTDWPTRYHLSGVRANILRPFESDLRGDILEIGAGCGAITRYLGECGGNVLALDGSPRRAAIARSRTRDLPNVTVVADQFEQFRIERQFDVVTLVGVLEYAPLFGAGDSPVLSMLQRARSLLKPDGKLIIAIENQLGLKYFAGAPEDHIGQPMYGIEGRYQSDQPQTFGRQFLAALIHQAGFVRAEFLLPFPDYKFPVCVITDEGLNAADFDGAELVCQSIAKDAQLPARTLFSLERAYPVIFLNGLATDLANSFLVIAANRAKGVSRPGILAYHWSTERRAAFCKETSFVRSDNRRIQVKRRMLREIPDPEPLLSASLSFKRSHDQVYCGGRTLYREFIEIVTRPGWNLEEIRQYFSNYLEIILGIARSEGCSCDSPRQDILLPGEFLDAIPANLILTGEGEAIYIDREWSAVRGISIDYLLFRAITSLLGSVSLFAQPQDPQLINRGSFVLALMKGLGFSPAENDFSRFLRLESELSVFSSGVENRVFSTWSPEASLPGCVDPSSIDALKLRLERTEAAKSVAEELAFERLEEVQRLQIQLAATETAKAYAEKLAFERYEELQQLHEQLEQTRGQLDAIHSSLGYKLLRVVKLASNRGKSNV